MSSMRTSRGFTLIEILMVVVIIGIAGAVIIPQLSSRDDLKVSSAARVVMSDLLYLQNLAITRQRNHYALFDATAQTYTLLDGAAMSVLTHPVSKNAYTMRFGSAGESGLRESKLVSAAFLSQPGGSAFTTIGFDEMGTPLIYDAGSTQPLVEGSVVLQCGVHKLKIVVASYTGQLSAEPAD